MVVPASRISAVACCSLGGRAMSASDAEQYSRQFAALADPVRLRVLSAIATAGEMCSCDLVNAVGRSQPTVSHHTRALAEAGLIVGDKRGRWVWWRVVPESMAPLRTVLS